MRWVVVVVDEIDRDHSEVSALVGFSDEREMTIMQVTHGGY